MKKPGADDIRKAARKASKRAHKGTDEGPSGTSPALKKSRVELGVVTALPVPRRPRSDGRPRSTESARGKLVEHPETVLAECSTFDLPAPVSPGSGQVGADNLEPARTSPSVLAGVSGPGSSCPPPSAQVPTGTEGQAPPDFGSLEGATALEDPATAIALFQSIMLPADVDKAAQCSLTEVTDSVFPALAWLVHAGLIMKGTLARRGRQCSSLKKSMDEAVAEKNAAEERLKTSEEELKNMAEKKTASESMAEAFLAEANLQARRVSDLESELAIMKAELAEEKAEGDRKQRELNNLASKSAEQSVLLQSLSDKLEAVEKEIEPAKQRAVEAFKDSQAFADAVADCSADSYRLGFADCKEATSKFYPELDLSKVRSPGDEELSEEEEEVGKGIANFIDEVIDIFQADEGGDAEESAPDTHVLSEVEEGTSERQA